MYEDPAKQMLRRLAEDKKATEAIKERLKDVPPDRRACSYTIWPYGPPDYKDKRFGCIDERFLRWIASNLSGSKDQEKLLYAKRAREELALRETFLRKMVGIKSSISTGGRSMTTGNSTSFIPREQYRIPIYEDLKPAPKDGLAPEGFSVKTITLAELDELKRLAKIAESVKVRVSRTTRFTSSAASSGSNKSSSSTDNVEEDSKPKKHGIEL
jgi:hypothetical protein